MSSPLPSNTPLPCDGIKLLDISYAKVKLLINDQKARIFPEGIQHKDGADCRSPGGGLWYDSVKGNCLPGFIFFKGNKIEIELRASSECPAQDSDVLKWVRREKKYINIFLRCGNLGLYGNLIQIHENRKRHYRDFKSGLIEIVGEVD